jgi:hypothetical protein
MRTIMPVLVLIAEPPVGASPSGRGSKDQRRDDTMTTGDSGIDSVGPGALGAGIGHLPASWDLEADVVVIGAGATGLPAAIAAIDAGASVIVVEANYDIGGHAMLSGDNVPLGGGPSAQRKYGIKDAPDLVLADLTDWSIVQPNGWPDYRYNDRAVMRGSPIIAPPRTNFWRPMASNSRRSPRTMLARTARGTRHRAKIMRSGLTARGLGVPAAEMERVWCGRWKRARGPRA